MLVLVGALAVAVALVGGATARAERGVAAAKCTKWKKVHGRRVCVRRAPVFVLGHYAGVTSQNAAIAFDLGTGGIVKVAVGELDVTCDPDEGSLAFASAAADVRIHPDAKGHFHAQLVTERASSRGVLTLDGAVDAKGHATGTASDTESVNANGVTAACASGAVTWSAGAGKAATQPAAGAKTGHYAGTTSQGGVALTFDVGPIGGILYAQNISILEIDGSCEPKRNFGLGKVSVPNTAVNGHGQLRFFNKVLDPLSGKVTRTFLFTGTLDGSGHGAGTLVETHHAILDDSGYLPVDYSCTSPVVSWSAVAS